MQFRQVIALVLIIGCVGGARPSGRGAAQLPVASALTISGTVFRSDKATPVAGVPVRLRSLDKGTIGGARVSDKQGGFSFAVSESGRYVVEAVDQKGHVVAVGDPVILAQSPVITNVILPSSHKAVALLLIAIASGAGVAGLIVGTNGTTSPER